MIINLRSHNEEKLSLDLNPCCLRQQALKQLRVRYISSQPPDDLVNPNASQHFVIATKYLRQGACEGRRFMSLCRNVEIIGQGWAVPLCGHWVKSQRN